jgi:hypothetical protein
MQRVEQRTGLLQIERVEAFSEPVVNRSEKIAGLMPLALAAPQPVRAKALTDELVTLANERRIRLRRRERDFASHAIDFGLAPPFLGRKAEEYFERALAVAREQRVRSRLRVNSRQSLGSWDARTGVLKLTVSGLPGLVTRTLSPGAKSPMKVPVIPIQHC